MNKTEISYIIQTLQQELDQASSPKSKAWWESYMKHIISFRGVSIPKIRELLGEL